MNYKKHTKGDWIFCNTHVDDSRGVLLFRSCRDFDKVNPYDFKLAATAPKLLRVCTELVQHAEKLGRQSSVYDIAKEVIEEATVISRSSTEESEPKIKCRGRFEMWKYKQYNLSKLSMFEIWKAGWEAAQQELVDDESQTQTLMNKFNKNAKATAQREGE